MGTTVHYEDKKPNSASKALRRTSDLLNKHPKGTYDNLFYHLWEMYRCRAARLDRPLARIAQSNTARKELLCLLFTSDPLLSNQEKCNRLAACTAPAVGTDALPVDEFIQLLKDHTTRTTAGTTVAHTILSSYLPESQIEDTFTALIKSGLLTSYTTDILKRARALRTEYDTEAATEDGTDPIQKAIAKGAVADHTRDEYNVLGLHKQYYIEALPTLSGTELTKTDTVGTKCANENEENTIGQANTNPPQHVWLHFEVAAYLYVQAWPDPLGVKEIALVLLPRWEATQRELLYTARAMHAAELAN